jgi:hypothetical protein
VAVGLRILAGGSYLDVACFFWHSSWIHPQNFSRCHQELVLFGCSIMPDLRWCTWKCWWIGCWSCISIL